jgi:hypothetical protein
MRIKSILIQPDASAWSAVVSYSGPQDAELIISCLYADGRLKVSAARYDHQVPMFSLGAEQAVLEWAQVEVANLPAEWHAAHAQLYGLDQAA